MATIDLGKISLTTDDEWSAGKAYERLVLLAHNGQAYVSKRDNMDVEPGTDETVWMLVSKRGESLYQMMVREGLFAGTEGEFLQQYQDTLKACTDATRESINQQYAVTILTGQLSDAEALRVSAESERESAETARGNAETVRAAAEEARERGERQRNDDTSAAIAESNSATSLSKAATKEAQTATREASAATIDATNAAGDAVTAADNATHAAESANQAAAGISGELAALHAKDTELEGMQQQTQAQLSTAEMVTAATLTEDANNIEGLRKIVIALISGQLYCQAFNAQDYRRNGAEVMQIKNEAPGTIPDFPGQLYIHIGSGAYIAVGSDSISDWKPITSE